MLTPSAPARHLKSARGYVSMTPPRCVAGAGAVGGVEGVI